MAQVITSSDVKKCRMCTETKPSTDFYPHRAKCKECIRKRHYGDREIPPVPRQCGWCDRDMNSDHANQRYCSDECRRAVKQEAWRAATRAGQERRIADYRANPKTCPVCLVIFVPTSKTHRSCSKVCSERLKDVIRLYGVTPEAFRAFVEAAGGRCQCCRKSSTDLHVDHCHSTGLVRGLLCPRCNSGVGQFLDDPALLRAAADYLERSE